jgi:hypothetical protein
MLHYLTYFFHTICGFSDVASKDMYTGDNESTKNSTWYGGNSDNAGFQEDNIEFSVRNNNNELI